MHRLAARLWALPVALALLFALACVALAAEPEVTIEYARPGQPLRYQLTINHDNAIWYTASFHAAKPVAGLSLENVSPNAQIFGELRYPEETAGGASGVVALRFARADGAPYTLADLGEVYTADLVLQFEDEGQARFPVEAVLGDAPHFKHWVAIDADGAEYPLSQLPAGRSYTLRAELADLGGVEETHRLSAKWSVLEGQGRIYLEEPWIEGGVATARLDTLARGSATIAIHTYLDGQLSSTYRYTLRIAGGGAPLSAAEVQEQLRMVGEAMVLAVPDNRSLGGEALEALQASARALAASQVQLQLRGGVTLAFAPAALAGEEFLGALDGRDFDPAVSLGLPAVARRFQYNEYNLRWLDFAHEGRLPSGTVVSVRLPKTAFIGGNPRLGLWRLNLSTGRLEAQPGTVQVQEDPARSDYLLCTFPTDYASVLALVPAGYTPTRSGSGQVQNPATGAGGHR